MKVTLLALALHMSATAIVWFKANAKMLYGIELHPIYWWLFTGWLLESFYLNAWWLLSEASGAWVAQITFSAAGTITGVILMSAFYGFHLKFVLAALLVFVALLITHSDI